MTEGQDGRVVPARSPEALAEALIDCLSRKKAREHYGRQAAATARQRFGTAHMVAGTLAVYREVQAACGS